MANFLTRNFISFLKKTCFLLLSALLLLPLYSCKNTVEYFDYVSEQRNNIFLAQTDDFYLRVYSVIKEAPYVADGIPMETSPRAEITLIAPQGDETYHISFLVDGKSYGGEMSFDNVRAEYSFSCTLDLSTHHAIDFQIQHGEESVTLTARSVLEDNTIPPQEILKIVQRENAELFESMTDKYGFSGEIYLRLLYEDAPYYYVGVIDRNHRITAFLINGTSGKILAKREG